MSEERAAKRPLKLFRVVIAHGPYCKGDTMQPTGLYRDVLVRRGLIEEIKDAAEAAPDAARQVESEADRMVRLPEKPAGRPQLHTRKNNAG